MAEISADVRQGNEYLGRPCLDGPVPRVPQACCSVGQFVEGRRQEPPAKCGPIVISIVHHRTLSLALFAFNFLSPLVTSHRMGDHIDGNTDRRLYRAYPACCGSDRSGTKRLWRDDTNGRFRMIEIIPVGGIGEVNEGDDLAALLAEAIGEGEQALRPGDILVVTQKIVSKAEGRWVALATVDPSPEAVRLAERTRKDPRLVALILNESTAIVRAVPGVLITRHRLGLVMANAGIDRSNIGPGGEDRVLLLPIDPDGSAGRLRRALQARFGFAPPVVISDSFGRPWRYGVVAVAIGVDGLPALVDRRGERDRDARPLESTEVALADMIATAASMATGEGAEGIPAVIVRGLVVPDGTSGAAALVRAAEEDLFQ